MNTTRTAKIWITSSVVALIVGSSATPAMAFPDPGEPGQPGTVAYQPARGLPLVTDAGVRLLGRIGAQFVRGDDLTGAGVASPMWIPEAL